MSDEQVTESVEQTSQEQTTTEATTAPNYTAWINEDGSFKDTFYTDHPEHLSEHSVIKNFKTVDDLMNGVINAKKTISQRASEFWKSEDEKDVAERREIMGIPTDSNEYEVTYPETFSGIPEDSQAAIKEYFKDSASWAKENNVPKDLYEKFAARDLERAISVYNSQVGEQEDAFEKATNDLKGEWKNSFDENNEKTADMAKMLGMEELIPVLDANPALRKAFFDGASKLVSDDTIIETNRAESVQTLSEQLDDLDDRMLGYEGDVGDRGYKRLLEKKMLLLKKLPQTS